MILLCLSGGLKRALQFQGRIGSLIKVKGGTVHLEIKGIGVRWYFVEYKGGKCGGMQLVLERHFLVFLLLLLVIFIVLRLQFPVVLG